MYLILQNKLKLPNLKGTHVCYKFFYKKLITFNRTIATKNRIEIYCCFCQSQILIAVATVDHGAPWFICCLQFFLPGLNLFDRQTERSEKDSTKKEKGISCRQFLQKCFCSPWLTACTARAKRVAACEQHEILQDAHHQFMDSRKVQLLLGLF